MTTDRDTDVDRSTDDSAGAADGTTGNPSATRLSRRGALGVLAALGTAGVASRSASAASTTLEFGGNYTGDPGSNYGLRLAPDGARFGLLGFSETGDGRGVVGRATAASGDTIGVLGRVSSTGGTALQGQADAATGRTYGAIGRSLSTSGRGFLGIAEASSGSTFGAIGKSRSPSGTGVEGNATAGSGTTYGVAGRANSPDGYGLYTPDDARIDGKLEFSEARGTDDEEVVITAGGRPVIRLDHTNDEANILNGVSEAEADVQGVTVAGGGATDYGLAQVLVPNEAFDNFGTIGGGLNNHVGSDDSDPKTARFATVSGGKDNRASDAGSTVGGGDGNTASGKGATVPGGEGNTADGAYSLAAGRGADANGHDGAFVFGDSTSTGTSARNDDEVRSQMPIYAPSFNTTSARAKKSDVVPVSPEAILDGVESLEICTWKLDHGDDARHLGPMAEDFHEQFGVGGDEAIASVDADGVALAAVQGLADRLEETAARLEATEERLADREDRIDDLESENEALRERLTDLEERLTDVEEE